MQSFPQPLSVEEENEAIERWEQGDREARNILIERNLRLVAYLVKKYSNSDHSVDDLISIGEGNALRFLDVLESVDEDIPERMEKEENVEKLYGYIEKNLTEREKLIIRLRYGVSEGKGTPENPEITQREIAKRLGISRSYVSRIEKKALQKLRCAYDYGRRKK